MNVVIKESDRDVVMSHLDDDCDILQCWVNTGSFYEIELLRYIRSLNVGGRYIDVGSNVGNHAVYFALFCPCSALTCLEPNPDIVEILRRNIYTNSIEIKYIIDEVAVGAKRGACGFLKPVNKNYGMGRACDRQCGSILIPMTTIDDYNYTDVGLIKIDIEGGEISALRGAAKTIETCSPVITCEAVSDVEVLEMRKYMKSIGYEEMSHIINMLTFKRAK